MPHSDNPNVKLVEALERVTKWETPYNILPVVKEYFLKMAPKQSPADRTFFEDIEKGLRDTAFSKRLTSNPILNAIVRDTISLTILRGGNKINVIPSESTASLDCRLIPGSSKEDFLKEVKKRLGDEVEVEVVSESHSLPPSPLDTDLFQAIQRLAAKNDPGCPWSLCFFRELRTAAFSEKKGSSLMIFAPFD